MRSESDPQNGTHRRLAPPVGLQCTREDSNLHTSRYRNLNPNGSALEAEIHWDLGGDSGDELAGIEPGFGDKSRMAKALEREARALLAAAAEQRSVDAARARAFARAVIHQAPLGRLGLDVLEGGPFCGRRLVELSRAVLQLLVEGDEVEASS